MKVLHSDEHKQHVPGDVIDAGAFRPGRDVPDRVDHLLKAAISVGLIPVLVRDHGPGPLAAVHSPEYLDFLAVAYDEWRKLSLVSPKVVPSVFPVRSTYPAYPKSIVGRAGYHMHDQLAPIGPGTWTAVTASANLAVDAAQHVLDGDPAAYALCRPSGHHAYKDMGGGATYLNNAGIAAQHLRSKYARVALLDVDVHHGNGTQDIFYRRDDVLFISMHRDPIDYHPYFYGHSHERGAGAGEGFNLNLPLPARTDNDRYVDHLDIACERITRFSAQALVVSLGLDAHKDDPSKGLALTEDGYYRIGARLASLRLPTVLVQEGGYGLSYIGSSLAAFLNGFNG